jgi:hypothetical protein
MTITITTLPSRLRPLTPTIYLMGLNTAAKSQTKTSIIWISTKLHRTESIVLLESKIKTIKLRINLIIHFSKTFNDPILTKADSSGRISLILKVRVSQVNWIHPRGVNLTKTINYRYPSINSSRFISTNKNPTTFWTINSGVKSISTSLQPSL